MKRSISSGTFLSLISRMYLFVVHSPKLVLRSSLFVVSTPTFLGLSVECGPIGVMRSAGLDKENLNRKVRIIQDLQICILETRDRVFLDIGAVHHGRSGP